MSYKFISSWRRQPFDPRDVEFRHITRQFVIERLAPTSQVDFSKVIKLDQGGLGSCGPNTDDELIMYDDFAQGLPVTSISRLHHYWWTRFIMGTTGSDSGVDNRSMLKALNQYGYVPDESLYPYSDDQSTFLQKPPDSVNQVGLQNKITSYSSLIQNLDQLKGCIAGSKKPFIIGFDVYQQFLGDAAAETGIIETPPASATPQGGHDTSFLGYTDVDQPGEKSGNKWPAGTFKFRNHWKNSDGSWWGDNGYGYFPYGYITSPHASDAWMIGAVPGGSPTPTPTPTPTPIPEIKAKIDALFVKLESAYRWYPGMVQFLKAVNSEVDKILAQYSLRRGVPPELIVILNAAIDAVVAAKPEWASYGALIKAAISIIAPYL